MTIMKAPDSIHECSTEVDLLHPLSTVHVSNDVLTSTKTNILNDQTLIQHGNGFCGPHIVQTCANIMYAKVLSGTRQL